jgi:hypothetical protein
VSSFLDLLVLFVVTPVFQAAKDVDASEDMLVGLFGRIENFFRRLESYTEVRPTGAMMDIIVNIMIEVLTILGIATKEIKQRRASELIATNWSDLTYGYAEKYMKKLLGKNDIESALKRLDALTQEEARMATVEVLKMMRSVDDKVNVVLDGARYIVIKPSTLCQTFVFLDGRETKQVTQQNANNTNVIMQRIDEAKRSSPQSISVSFRSSLTLTGEELRQDIQKWLSPPDPSINHNIPCGIQHQVTASWFFDSGIYKEWKLDPSLLWVRGKRRSVLTSFAS